MRSKWSMTCMLMFTSFVMWVSPPVNAGDGEAARVTVVETPEGGIQPQAAIDEQGVIH